MTVADPPLIRALAFIRDSDVYQLMKSGYILVQART